MHTIVLFLRVLNFFVTLCIVRRELIRTADDRLTSKITRVELSPLEEEQTTRKNASTCFSFNLVKLCTVSNIR